VIHLLTVVLSAEGIRGSLSVDKHVHGEMLSNRGGSFALSAAASITSHVIGLIGIQQSAEIETTVYLHPHSRVCEQ
jgi:hypothetical protein